MKRLSILAVAFALVSSAEAATYCRPVGGHLIDCYAAASAAELQSRMAVSGFVVVPDNTRNGSAVTLDGGGNVATITPPPDPPAPVAKPRPVSKLEFLHMFTMPEIAAAGALKATTLFTFWTFYEAAATFDRDAAETIGGLAALVATGCITQNRADAILAAWPPAQ